MIFVSTTVPEITEFLVAPSKPSLAPSAPHRPSASLVYTNSIWTCRSSLFWKMSPAFSLFQCIRHSSLVYFRVLTGATSHGIFKYVASSPLSSFGELLMAEAASEFSYFSHYPAQVSINLYRSTHNVGNNSTHGSASIISHKYTNHLLAHDCGDLTLHTTVYRNGTIRDSMLMNSTSETKLLPIRIIGWS